MARQDSNNPASAHESPYQLITAECDAMLRHAIGKGCALRPTTVEAVAAAVAWVQAQHQHAADQLSQAELDRAKGNAPSIARLSKTHQQLARAVAPAQPRPLRLLSTNGKSRSENLWLRLPMPRNMTIVAVLSILVLLGVGTSPLISADPAAGNPLLSSGTKLFVNQLFFLSIASLGSCFHGLFKVNEYIVKGTYDPNYAATYWVRYLLGVISGLVLASLIDVDQNSALYTIARPVLALVGGFSAAVVHRVLERLVSTIESLIAGDDKELVDHHKRLAQADGEARVRDARVDTAAALMKLQTKLQDGMTPALARAEISVLVKKLVPEGEMSEDDASADVAASAPVKGVSAPELAAPDLATPDPDAPPEPPN